MRITKEAVHGNMSEITERLSRKGHALSFVILVLLMAVTIDSAPVKDFQLGTLLGQRKPWHDVVIRRFYGPWSILRKQNGDYVDYNDYDALSNQPVPTDLFHDKPISHGYLNDYPSSTFASGLSIFNSIYSRNPVGLAVFSMGIRTDQSDDNVGNYGLTESVVAEPQDIGNNTDNTATTTEIQKTEPTEPMETTTTDISST